MKYLFLVLSILHISSCSLNTTKKQSNDFNYDLCEGSKFYKSIYSSKELSLSDLKFEIKNESEAFNKKLTFCEKLI